MRKSTFRFAILLLLSISTISCAKESIESHNYYMLEVGKVSHDNFGARYENLVEAVGAKSVSENVGFGYRTAEAVVNAWLNSDGHKKNIEGNHSHFGVSVVDDAEGRNYFTNIFIRK